MSGDRTKSIESTSAGPITVYRAGSGDPVVLLHGNGHSVHEFERSLPFLTPRFALIGWDMPGHGASNEADAALSIDERASVLGEILERQAIGPAVLVGNSIGAFVAAALAARAPERVKALLLVEMQVRPRAWWDAAWQLVDRMFGTPRQDFDTVQARLCSPLDVDLLARWNGDRTRAGAGAMIAAMESIRAHDVMATLAALTVPTHFLFGEKGPAAECAPAALDCVAHATSEIVPGAGHFVSIDQPAAFAAAVERAAQAQGDC